MKVSKHTAAAAAEAAAVPEVVNLTSRFSPIVAAQTTAPTDGGLWDLLLMLADTTDKFQPLPEEAKARVAEEQKETESEQPRVEYPVTRTERY